jgi:hypothetical protein
LSGTEVIEPPSKRDNAVTRTAKVSIEVYAMIRFGTLLVVLGFGSMALYSFNYHFTLLAWADEMQPFFGGAVGVVGLLVIGASFLFKRGKDEQAQPQPGAAAPQAQYPPQQQFPQQPRQSYPQQSFGAATQHPGYPQQPGQSFGPQG